MENLHAGIVILGNFNASTSFPSAKALSLSEDNLLPQNSAHKLSNSYFKKDASPQSLPPKLLLQTCLKIRRHRLDRFPKNSNYPPELFLSNHIRRRQDDMLDMQLSRPAQVAKDIQPQIQRQVDDLVAKHEVARGKRRAGISVLYELDGPEEAPAADIADVAQVREVRVQQVVKNATHVLDVVEKVVPMDDLLHLEGACAGRWVCLYEVAKSTQSER